MQVKVKSTLIFMVVVCIAAHAESFGALHAEDVAAEANLPRSSWDKVALWDIAFPTVDGLSYIDATQKWGGGSASFFKWWARYRESLRSMGMAAWMESPDDPRRFKWLMRTVHSPPFYWVNLEQGAVAFSSGDDGSALVDDAARDAWDKRYVFFREQFMNAPEVDDKARALLRYSELYYEMGAFLSVQGRRSLKVDTESLANAVLDAARMPAMPSRSVDALARNLLSIMEDDCQLEGIFIDAMKISPRTELRMLAEGQEQVMRLRNVPLSLTMEALDGGTIDVSDVQGKVFLIDIWSNNCASCIEAMPRLQRVYDKYKKDGFEVVGIWLNSSGAREDVAKARTIIDRQGAGWRNGMLTGRELEQFKEQYAINGVPVTWLFDADGSLVTTDVSGHRLESEIERLLKIGNGKNPN